MFLIGFFVACIIVFSVLYATGVINLDSLLGATTSKGPANNTLEFGGMYTTTDTLISKAVNNPATGSKSCPTGFSNKSISGEKNNFLKFCYKKINDPSNWTPTPGSMEFGGMISKMGDYVLHTPGNNSLNCPDGFKKQYIIEPIGGDSGIEMAYCYKEITDPATWTPSAKSLQFGGMNGFVNGKPVVNVSIGSKGCPSKFNTYGLMADEGEGLDMFNYCAAPWST